MDSSHETEERTVDDRPEAEGAPVKRRWWRSLPSRLVHAVAEIRHTPWQAAAVLTATGVGIVMLGMALTLIPGGHPLGSPQERLDLALKALADGDPATARRMATDLRAHPELSFEELGGAAYILGATLVHNAEGDWNHLERKNNYLIASRYFEESRERGFPVGFEDEGLYLLGRALYHSGRRDESLPVLIAVRETIPEHAAEVDGYLGHVYAELDPPDLERALWHNQQYVASPDISLDDRLAGILHQSRLLMKTGDVEAARQRLLDVVQLAETSPDLQDSRSYLTAATVMRGRLLLEEADRFKNAPDAADLEAAQKLYEAARDLFLAAHLKALDNSQTSFLLGVAHQRLGDLPAAEKQFAITRRRNYTTPEAFAAHVEEAEIQRTLKKQKEAIESYRNLLREAPKPTEYDNPWISLETVRERVLAIYQQALADQRYADADLLVDHLVPTFPEEQAVQLKAETQQAWAQHYRSQAEQTSGVPAQKLNEDARRHFHYAGQMYKKLADLRLAARAYPDEVWRAAENYLASGDYREAVVLLERYMQNEPQKRRPRALTLLGDALLSLDRTDEALVPLRECLEFHPKHPDSYRARILAAHAMFEKGDLTGAKELLRKNLEHEALTPQSIEWRDSQFLLGKLSFKEGQILSTRSRELGVADPLSPTQKEAFDALETASEQFAESLRRLNSTVERYPNAPQATEARYLIAQAHFHRAKYPQQRAAAESIESTQVDWDRQIRHELQESINHFLQLQNQLTDKQDEYELSEVESRILRNCYFTRGHALFDLGRYEEAIKAYSSATNQFQNQPASLEAYVQIANCYRQLGNPFRARGTLEQALVVLEQIPPEADFSTTRFKSRESWPTLLNWLKSL